MSEKAEKTRKRRKRGEGYDRSHNKRLKESGLAYQTRRQKHVGAKLPPSQNVTCKCQLNCKLIPYARKLDLFTMFYKLLGEEKGTYIMSLIKIVPVQRRRHGKYHDPAESRRQTSVHYFIPVDGQQHVRVCKNTLIDIYKVTRKQMSGYVERKKLDEEKFSDGRGKTKEKNKFTCVDRELIQEHINAITREEYEEHVGLHLNISRLFKTFKEKYPESLVTYKYFSTALKEDYPTLHFKKSNKDICNECEFLSFQIKIEEQKYKLIRFINMSLGRRPLIFNVLAECKTSKARKSKMILPHGEVDTPVFMPVGTQGTMKGILPEQLENLDIQIMLSNTYHLGIKPGVEILEKAGGLHKFMNWNRALLTDSGGFQMVSLLKLAEITEEGVKFQSLSDLKSEIVLTPEHSIHIQNAIGADIVMQLDDVIKTTSPDEKRIEEAMHRTSRWLDRCLKAHKRPQEQNIFPIVQGTLNSELRTQSAQAHIQKDVNGFAIGGLSGGESKDDFWRMVHLSTDILPKDKPRYLMGVGFAVDLVVCCALGVDMFDCVFPTRTARFGCALVMTGQLNLKNKTYKKDFNPIDKDCNCSTCTTYTRSYLHHIVTQQSVACHLLSVHNLAFQLRLMKNIRDNIENNTYPEFVANFMQDLYPDKCYPTWIVNALAAVNINL